MTQTKIVRVIFKQIKPVLGLRSGTNFLAVGDNADTSWGGGKIASLTCDRSINSLVIRKADSEGKPVKFERTAAGERASHPTFDACIVPWDDVLCACGVDEVVAVEVLPPAGQDAKPEQDPPPAQPAAKQGQNQAQHQNQQPRR